MPLVGASAFLFSLLGDGLSSSGKLDLRTTPLVLEALTSPQTMFLDEKTPLPVAAFEVSVAGTVGGKTVGFPPGQTAVSISKNTMTIGLPFVPDSGTLAFIRGFFQF